VLDRAATSLARKDLAVEIVRDRRDELEGDLGKELVTQVEVSLHHVHVPKLAAAGFITYDEATERVSIDGSVPLTRFVDLVQ
jgi:hypothetical protein